MSKTRFLYSGPSQTVSLREPADNDAGSELRDVDFVPGAPVELLDEHPIAIAFTAAGYLKSAPAEPSAAADTAEPAAALPAASQE